jgi:hypothetical protein
VRDGSGNAEAPAVPSPVIALLFRQAAKESVKPVDVRLCLAGWGGGGGVRATGLWPSQAAVAAASEAFVYRTHFHLELRALVGSLACGFGDPQANASPSKNGRSRRLSAVSAPTIK